MLWTQDPAHPFAGIVEKLKRANENIVDLNGEISAFFEASKYPIVPDVNSQEWQQALDYHRALVVPPRFSVLSGEIIHHLRSCLDHIAWYFSSPQYRIDGENAIEFPVFRKEPIAKKELQRYERKVKGITNPQVLSLIRDMQPYKRGSDAEIDPVCIVHDLDRFDKHRELAIVVSCANVLLHPNTSLEAVLAVTKSSQGEALTSAELALVSTTLKQNAKVLPQIAFPHLGKWKVQSVIPMLSQLHEAIFKRIDSFKGLV